MVILSLFHLSLRSSCLQLFIGLVSAMTEQRHIETHRLSSEHTGIKSAMKSTQTTRAPLSSENQSKANPLATDEIVVLHVTHTDSQPDRVVMKQRPSWLHYVSLKTKIPQRSSSFKLMCYRERGHRFTRQRGSSLMDGTQSNARPIRCSPNRRERAFAGREINK